MSKEKVVYRISMLLSAFWPQDPSLLSEVELTHNPGDIQSFFHHCISEAVLTCKRANGFSKRRFSCPVETYEMSTYVNGELSSH